MKTKLLALFSFLTLLLVPVSTVMAQETVCDIPGSEDSSFCQNQDDSSGNPTNNSVIDIVNTLIRVLTTVAIVIATITTIVGGLQFVVSGGDPGGISRARNTIIYSIVAIVVAIFARVIIIYVLEQL